MGQLFTSTIALDQAKGLSSAGSGAGKISAFFHRPSSRIQVFTCLNQIFYCFITEEGYCPVIKNYNINVSANTGPVAVGSQSAKINVGNTEELGI